MLNTHRRAIRPDRSRALANVTGSAVTRSTIIFATCVALGSCWTEPASPVENPSEPIVADVVDGDTIIVRFPTGAEETVRLLGIDTPETVDPNRPEQCFGAEASAHVASVLRPGTTIRIERDVEARDHFGRLLAYVFRENDDLFVNLDLLERGFADLSIYPPNDAYAQRLGAATTSARTRSVGLWGACGGPDVPIDPP